MKIFFHGKYYKLIAAAVFTAIIVVLSCEPLEKVSEIPAISFKSFDLFEIDTFSNRIKVGELKFDFIDGNADLGIDPNDFSENDTVNLFLIPWEKVGDDYFLLPVDTLKYQIRYDEKLSRVGQNKTIKGELKLMIYYFITPPYDTLRYDFYITDRAGNNSNTESTDDIGFK